MLSLVHTGVALPMLLSHLFKLIAGEFVSLQTCSSLWGCLALAFVHLQRGPRGFSF